MTDPDIMKEQIESLASNGFSVREIASMLGVSVATVYRYLDLKKDTPPPRYHYNRYRRYLAQTAWKLVVEEGMPYTKAAAQTIAKESSSLVQMASGSRRPVTTRRLVEWMKPEARRTRPSYRE